MKATPLRAAIVLPAGFVRVKVSAVDPFTEIVAAVNALLIVGGRPAVSVAVLPSLPSHRWSN